MDVLENIQRYNKICCVFLQCAAVKAMWWHCNRDFGCYSNTHSQSSFMQPCKMSVKFAQPFVHLSVFLCGCNESRTAELIFMTFDTGGSNKVFGYIRTSVKPDSNDGHFT
jgi:hypothetical protein